MGNTLAITSDAVLLDGTAIDDSTAVITQIIESAGTYTVTANGTTVTPDGSGLYTIVDGIQIKIDDGKAIVVVACRRMRPTPRYTILPRVAVWI